MTDADINSVIVIMKKKKVKRPRDQLTDEELDREKEKDAEIKERRGDKDKRSRSRSRSRSNKRCVGYMYICGYVYMTYFSGRAAKSRNGVATRTSALALAAAHAPTKGVLGIYIYVCG